MILRRHFNLALGLLTLAPVALCARSADDSSRGPLFWRITRGKARVYLLGFGDARDESWFTPTIRKAFADSSELWLEVGHDEEGGSGDAVAKAREDAAYEQLSHESSGHTFFDDLAPDVRQRTLTYMADLGVTKESVEALRPWSAYYTINSAFWSRTKLPYQPVMVADVLRKLATGQHKTIGYEMPTGMSFARFMATMPDKAQSQYVGWLLDFFDDYRKGFNGDSWFDWAGGNPTINLRSLDRMRARAPDLYQCMQVQRNTWWARKIDQLLAAGGTRFVATGELHVLGPDGIPSQLERHGIVGPSGLKENPLPDATG
jgi:uncharacterized protein YbaP (TraB family)